MNNSFKIFIYIVLIFSTSLSYGAVYKCTDSNNSITFQQNPCSSQDSQIEMEVNKGNTNTIDSSNQYNEAPLQNNSLEASKLESRENLPPVSSYNSSNDYPSDTPDRIISPEDISIDTIKQALEKQMLVSGALFISLIVATWYNLVLIYLSFKQHILWGLGFVFVPFVSIIYIIMHWSDAGRPFLLSMVFGIIAFGCGSYIMPVLLTV